MSKVQRKQQDLDHQNQDQRCDGERADTGMKQEIPGTQTSSLRQSMSAARKALQLLPCSSGKSASSEPEGQGNKGSASCLQHHSSATQSVTAEPERTSKIPHIEKPRLVPRRFLHRLFHGKKELPAWYHNKLRSEHVKDRVLNGSTHGEASKQTPSRDILKSEDEMKHFVSITNTEEITDSERLSSTDSLDSILGTTHDLSSSESEGEKSDDDALTSRQDTHKESDSTACLWTDCQSSSASTVPSHGDRSLQSLFSRLNTSTSSDRAPANGNGYTPNPVLERRRPPLWSPRELYTGRYHRGFEPYLQEEHQYLPWLQSGGASRPKPACPNWTRFRLRQSALVNREEDTVQEGTGTSDTLQPSDEAWGSTSSGQLDNLNADDMMTVSDIELVHVQERREAQEGAAAVQNTESRQDSSKEIVCRPKQRLSAESSSEEEADRCRICHSCSVSPNNPLLSPCRCSGSLQFIHLNCLKAWILTKLESRSNRYDARRCEVCMERLTLNPATFDLDAYCRIRHPQENITELYNLREAAEVLTFRSLHSRALLVALVTPSCPFLGIPMRPTFYNDMIRRTIRRPGERDPSPDAPDT